MENYGKSKKRFVFYMTDDEHARFIAKTASDNIKKLVIIKDFINAYVNEDPNIMAWLEGNLYCKKTKKYVIRKKRENKKMALKTYDFNLEGKDVKEIFDILAEEDKDV